MNLMELNKRIGKHLTYQTSFELFLHDLSLIYAPYYLQFIIILYGAINKKIKDQ